MARTHKSEALLAYLHATKTVGEEWLKMLGYDHERESICYWYLFTGLWESEMKGKRLNKSMAGELLGAVVTANSNRSKYVSKAIAKGFVQEEPSGRNRYVTLTPEARAGVEKVLGRALDELKPVFKRRS